MSAAKQTAIILLILAALSLVASAQQNPCLSSQASPPPSGESPNAQQELQQQNDVSGRSAQLDCVQKQAGTTPAEIAARHAAQQESLRSQVQSLKADSDSLVELAVEFKDYVTQSNGAELPSEQIHKLQQIVAVSHSIRETLAGHGLPGKHRKAEHNSFSSDRQMLLQKADQCLNLATDLKQKVNGYVQQNNQNTISAVEMKDKKVSSSISKTAEELESLASELQKAAGGMESSAK